VEEKHAEVEGRKLPSEGKDDVLGGREVEIGGFVSSGNTLGTNGSAEIVSGGSPTPQDEGGRKGSFLKKSHWGILSNQNSRYLGSLASKAGNA